MQEMYKNSLKIMKRLKEKPSKIEWNKIAKEKCLMSYLTVQRWENKSFEELWKEVKG